MVKDLDKIIIEVTKYELALIRRLARLENRTVPEMTWALVNKSLNVVRLEERTGWIYELPPKLSPHPASVRPPS